MANLAKMPRIILRLEGLAILAASAALYFYQGWDWVMFIVLFFVPDVSMIGYLKGRKIGSLTYNMAHNYVLPVALLSASFIYSFILGIQLSIIWLGHIGLDRAIGYGLKYPTFFKDTHLNRI